MKTLFFLFLAIFTLNCNAQVVITEFSPPNCCNSVEYEFEDFNDRSPRLYRYSIDYDSVAKTLNLSLNGNDVSSTHLNGLDGFYFKMTEYNPSYISFGSLNGLVVRNNSNEFYIRDVESVNFNINFNSIIPRLQSTFEVEVTAFGECNVVPELDKTGIIIGLTCLIVGCMLRVNTPRLKP